MNFLFGLPAGRETETQTQTQSQSSVLDKLTVEQVVDGFPDLLADHFAANNGSRESESSDAFISSERQPRKTDGTICVVSCIT